jgi:hypothetical protein
MLAHILLIMGNFSQVCESAIFLLLRAGGSSYLHSCKVGTKLGESESLVSKFEGEQ